jgi:hypothetical protein
MKEEKTLAGLVYSNPFIHGFWIAGTINGSIISIDHNINDHHIDTPIDNQVDNHKIDNHLINKIDNPTTTHTNISYNNLKKKYRNFDKNVTISDNSYTKGICNKKIKLPKCYINVKKQWILKR